MIVVENIQKYFNIFPVIRIKILSTPRRTPQPTARKETVLARSRAGGRDEAAQRRRIVADISLLHYLT